MAQAVPGSVGRASVSLALRAIPVPPLVTVRVSPTGSPAETERLSACLATSMAAPRTSTEAEAESVPSLVVVTSAVLSTEIGRAAGRERGEERGTVEEAPGARSSGPQVRVPAAMAQVVKAG